MRGRRGSSSGSASDVEVGEEARGVVWLPDSAAPRCQHCKNHFWLARRRHHCRSLPPLAPCSPGTIPVFPPIILNFPSSPTNIYVTDVLHTSNSRRANTASDHLRWLYDFLTHRLTFSFTAVSRRSATTAGSYLHLYALLAWPDPPIHY